MISSPSCCFSKVTPLASLELGRGQTWAVPLMGEKGWQGTVLKGREGGERCDAKTQNATALPQKRGQREVGMAPSPASPLHPLSPSSLMLQGRSRCVCQARCHLEASGYFSVCSDGHVRLVDPCGLLCFCCLIINHLNGDVNSRSRLHPHQKREPRDPFTHHRLKNGLLGKQVWAVRASISETSLLSSAFATSALLGLRSRWKVMMR